MVIPYGAESKRSDARALPRRMISTGYVEYGRRLRIHEHFSVGGVRDLGTQAVAVGFAFRHNMWCRIGNFTDESFCAGPAGGRVFLQDEGTLMSDVVSFTEIDGQHVELLPGRILLQMSAVIYDTETGRFFTDIDGDGGVDSSDVATAQEDPEKTIIGDAPSIVTPA